MGHGHSSCFSFDWLLRQAFTPSPRLGWGSHVLKLDQTSKKSLPEPLKGWEYRNESLYVTDTMP